MDPRELAMHAVQAANAPLTLTAAEARTHLTAWAFLLQVYTDDDCAWMDRVQTAYTCACCIEFGHFLRAAEAYPT